MLPHGWWQRQHRVPPGYDPDHKVGRKGPVHAGFCCTTPTLTPYFRLLASGPERHEHMVSHCRCSSLSWLVTDVVSLHSVNEDRTKCADAQKHGLDVLQLLSTWANKLYVGQRVNDPTFKLLSLCTADTLQTATCQAQVFSYINVQLSANKCFGRLSRYSTVEMNFCGKFTPKYFRKKPSPCDAGKFADQAVGMNVGSSHPTQRNPTQKLSDSTELKCVECPIGQFQEEDFKWTCLDCPPGEWMLHEHQQAPSSLHFPFVTFPFRRQVATVYWQVRL